MEQIRTVLCLLTKRICGELEGLVIENKPIWTVVNQPGAAPHVALDG
ncbi:hypothetical protein ACFLYL_04740 [Chloroflexota bacterium]